MTQPIHTCPGGRERPAWGKERPAPEPPGPQTPASSDPGLGFSGPAGPGVARHTRVPATVLTFVYLPQVQPSSTSNPVSLPQEAHGYWLPGLWVTAELSQWEMAIRDEGEEGDRGWLCSCWAPEWGGGRGPRFPRATAPVQPPPTAPSLGPRAAPGCFIICSPLFTSVPTNPVHYPGVTVGVRHLGCLLP